VNHLTICVALPLRLWPIVQPWKWYS